jgi:hypothetical protein
MKLRTSIRNMGVVALAAGIALLIVPSTQAQAGTSGPLRAHIDRFTTAIYQSGTPVADPETAPAVNVFATIRGCTPGEYFFAHFTMVQDGKTLTNTAGMSPGAGEQQCGPDGTVRISEPQLGLFVSSVPRPGPAWASLTVAFNDGRGAVYLGGRKVYVPGPCVHGKGSRWARLVNS